jgi:hypothetical protein
MIEGKFLSLYPSCLNSSNAPNQFGAVILFAWEISFQIVLHSLEGIRSRELLLSLNTMAREPIPVTHVRWQHTKIFSLLWAVTIFCSFAIYIINSIHGYMYPITVRSCFRNFEKCCRLKLINQIWPQSNFKKCFETLVQLIIYVWTFFLAVFRQVQRYLQKETILKTPKHYSFANIAKF